MELMQCPEGLHDDFRSYYLYGQRPSGVVSAILIGNLFAAFDQADVDTRDEMPRIVQFVRDAFPATAFGSAGNVSGWMSRGGCVGRMAANKRPIPEHRYRGRAR